MSKLVQDLHFALRVLRRTPGYTAVALLSLGLGIGGNTAVFSIYDALLLKQLPVKDPQHLVMLSMKGPFFGQEIFEYDLYDGLKTKARSFSELAAVSDLDLAMSNSDVAERVSAEMVSGNFFSMLGVRAHYGRMLTVEDDHPSTGALPVVLSYSFWQRRFGADHAAIGKNIWLKGYPFVIVGVLPRSFNGIRVETSSDICIPISARTLVGRQQDEWAYEIFGRLRPGITPQQAQAEFQTLYIAIERSKQSDISPQLKKSILEMHADVQPVPRGTSELRTKFSVALYLLIAATAMVLLIACANLAGLLLVRATTRSKEIAMRLALGATRARLIRQLLTESILVALLGGILGAIIAFWFSPTLLRWLPAGRGLDPFSTTAMLIEPNLRLLAFTMAVSVAVGILFGLVPAIQSTRLEPNSSLKGIASGSHRFTSGRTLVVAQVALSTVLIIGSGWFIRSLGKLRATDPGFNREHIALFAFDPSLSGYTTPRIKGLINQLLTRVESLPNVRAVGIASASVMRGIGLKDTVAAEGHTVTSADALNTSFNSVTPGYFESMGMRLLEGRDFRPDEKNGPGARPVIVNEAFARRFFPNMDPLGKHFGPSFNSPAKDRAEVIGVVSDAKYRTLREKSPPVYYTPLLTNTDLTWPMVLHVRTWGNPMRVIDTVRAQLRGLDPSVPFYDVQTMTQQVETSLWQEKLVTGLCSIFGFMAALLAAIGLYGVLDYSVKQRTREIGIRMALGVQREAVLWMVLRQTLLLVAAGFAIGLPATLAAGRLVSSRLYGVKLNDPVTVTAAVMVVAGIAVLAGYMPAKRASNVHPMDALRWE